MALARPTRVPNHGEVYLVELDPTRGSETRKTGQLTTPFGIVQRGGAMIILKAVGVDPLPNYRREPAARWDAYVYVPDPDALASEFASRNVEFSAPLKDDDDGLRGFELKDLDGYVLFFGRTRE